MDEFGKKASSAMKAILKNTDPFLEKKDNKSDNKELDKFWYAVFRGKKTKELKNEPIKLVVHAKYLSFGTHLQHTFRAEGMKSPKKSR